MEQVQSILLQFTQTMVLMLITVEKLDTGVKQFLLL